MVFSLFSRKDKSSPRKPSSTAARGPDSTIRGPSATTASSSSTSVSPSTERQRELARQTAEKIDRIESEMIAAALPVPPAPKRVQARLDATRAQPEPGGPVTLPPLQIATHAGPSLAASASSASLAASNEADYRVVDGHLAPELEEAAILYANGQADAAAATLMNVLVDGHPLSGQAQAWMMLLDVHQRQHDQEAFETLAIQYAARFESSPPAWRVIAGEPGPVRPATPARGGLGIAVPARLDAGFAKSAELAERARQGKRLVSVDLGAVRQIEREGVALLLSLIRAFKAGESPLVLANASVMVETLRPQVQPGRSEAGEDVWMLALELLRVQGLRTAFDDLSIDYCVTFEVSPPSWEPMPAHVRETAPGDAPVAVDDEAAALSAEAGAVDPRAVGGIARGFTLAGEVVGRMQKELEALRAHAEDRSQVLIDCRDLTRLDFVAAGELLNDVVALRSAGKEVVFVDVSAIIAALLAVMGIQELAEIRKRRI